MKEAGKMGVGGNPKRAANHTRIEQDAATVDWILEARERGDDAPFGELVERYAPRVFSVLRGLLASEADAEDVSQEVFLKVYRSLPRFHRRSSLFTWIYRVAVNAAHDWGKKHRRHRHASLSRSPEGSGNEILDPVAEGEIPAAGLEEGERIRAVHAALAELPERYRTILVLRELEGLTYEEIADALSLKKGTVESRLFRARQMLKQVMSRLRLDELL